MKLNQELAYLIGFWKMRPTVRGIGVVGNISLQQKFIDLVLKLKLTTPQKMFIEENSVLFHHIKWKNIFRKVVLQQHDLFGKRNALSAAYLKGMFDSAGRFEGGRLLIAGTTFRDRMLIERLGFYTRPTGKKLIIAKASEFLDFIK